MAADELDERLLVRFQPFGDRDGLEIDDARHPPGDYHVPVSAGELPVIQSHHVEPVGPVEEIYYHATESLSIPGV